MYHHGYKVLVVVSVLVSCYEKTPWALRREAVIIEVVMVEESPR